MGAHLELRCSPQARAHGLAPIGTAVSARTHVLVDTPLPWPADLATTELHEAIGAIAGPDARIHGVVPERGADGARVVVHFASDGPFTRYRRHAATVDPGDVPAAVRGMLDGDGDGAVEQPGTDVLVCGHGSRDRCCGSMGTALAARAIRDPATFATVWRTGHLGGHRFAPTAIVLPSGTAWAWLDDEVLAAVVGRSRPPADLIRHYRGSTAVVHPAAQLAEAQVFARVGWAWLDGPRQATIVDEPAAQEWAVRVDGAGATWRARVREVGRVPQPVCGSDEPGRKDDPVLDLVELVGG